MDDSLGYRSDLMDALHDPDLNKIGIKGEANGASWSAFAVMLAVGKCKLYDVDIKDLGSTVPPRLVIAAFDQIKLVISSCLETIDRLVSKWDEWREFEAENAVTCLLSVRNDLWAISVAYEDTLLIGANHFLISDLQREYEGIKASIIRIDKLLLSEVNILSTVDEITLSNWREPLSDKYRNALPWWLDGTLEKTAKLIADKAEKSIPSASQWKNLRNQILEVNENL